jgi:hypothetical protein
VVTTSPTFNERCLGSRSINRPNCEPLFVPGGSAMHILVPWKLVVLVWGLLSEMILVSFVDLRCYKERTASRQVRSSRSPPP